MARELSQEVLLEKAQKFIASNFGLKDGKEYKQAIAYYMHYFPLMDDEKSAKDLGLTIEEYAEAGIENGILDGEHLEMEPMEFIVQKSDDEQEFIDVDQEEVKRALRALTARQNSTIEELYRKHSEYNEEFFGGRLSAPFITIEKLSNRTLGNYTHGADEMGITNHIRFNRDFIALNDMERILETLRHEMIHQWQDEVLYQEKGKEKEKLEYPVTEQDKDDKDLFHFTGKWETIEQKKRPKNWHNRDFKDMASVVGIPARGKKCYGNPAKMPEPKSYNRKFICGCIASNGHHVTVWSTRTIDATCNRCGNKLVEVPKSGKVIEVKMSHVEQGKEDAVKQQMLADGYPFFHRFKTREEKEDFVDSLQDPTYTEGTYQHNHNAYEEGYRYWVAHHDEDVKMPKKRKPKEAKKTEPKPKAKKPAPKKEPKAKLSPKKPTVQPKKKDAPKSAPKKPSVKKQAPKTMVPKGMVVGNPAYLIQVYNEVGTIKGIADMLGVSKDEVLKVRNDFKINFGKGTYEVDGKTISSN